MAMFKQHVTNFVPCGQFPPLRVVLRDTATVFERRIHFRNQCRAIPHGFGVTVFAKHQVNGAGQDLFA
ncbi:hypothetical protein D3C87_1867670 [compost metagenome]